MSFYLLYTNNMIFLILQTTILSIIFILLIHHLIDFFKSTLTIPKMKDLVNAPTQKYDNIYNIINVPSVPSNQFVPSFIPEVKDMKHELKHFLKSQLKDGQN